MDLVEQLNKIEDYYKKIGQKEYGITDYRVGINFNNISNSTGIKNFTDLQNRTWTYFGTGAAEKSFPLPGKSNAVLTLNSDDAWKTNIGNNGDALTFFMNVKITSKNNDIMPITFNNGNTHIFDLYLYKNQLGINTWNSDAYGFDFTPYYNKFITLAIRIRSGESIEFWIDGRKIEVSQKRGNINTISHTKIVNNLQVTLGASLNKDYICKEVYLGSLYIYDYFLEEDDIVKVSKVLKFGMEHPESLRTYGMWKGNEKYLLLTPNGGLQEVAVIEDKNYNLWAVVGKFNKNASDTVASGFKSRRGLIDTYSTEGAVLSADWGDFTPKEQLFLCVNDIYNYTSNYYCDFGYGVPSGRTWAKFWTSGNNTGMKKDPYNKEWRWGFDITYTFSIKWGWRNDNLKFIRVNDQNANISDTLNYQWFRFPGGTFHISGTNQNDAKFISTRLNTKAAGQDQDNVQIGFGEDDGAKKFFDISYSPSSHIGNNDTKVDFDTCAYVLIR